jgi:NTP pyrophosphatase (non-canonical NTP hydrolase)
MTFADYQSAARLTAIYPRDHAIIYPMLGLCGEVGECAEKLKKVIRDCDCEFSRPLFLDDITKELGDVLWYLSNLASDLHLNLDVIAERNLQKLAARQEQGKLGGSGDNREEPAK